MFWWRKLQYSLVPKSKRLRTTPAYPDADYGPDANKPDMDDDEYQRAKAVFLKDLHKSEEERKLLERSTIGQALNILWKQERLVRLTASVVGSICKMREYTSCANKVKTLLYSTFTGSAATNYGVENEPFAIAKLERDYGLQVEPCGLFVDAEQSYLGASPDGLVGEDYLVEIKCPYSARDYTVQEAVTKKILTDITIVDNEVMKLKPKTNYMYQVQAQLHVTRRKTCYFTVYTKKNMMVEEIERDDQFWEKNCKNQLERFYMNCLLPELVDPRHKRGLPIKDPDYILEAQKQRQSRQDEIALKRAEKEKQLNLKPGRQ